MPDQPSAPTRPHMPDYGLLPADEGAGLMPWSRVCEQMVVARNYWISTTRPDGRPHATPVWGAWVDEMLIFGAGPGSVKVRNLAANPNIVVHLESGDDVVVLEGVAERLRDTALFARADAAYAEKYNWHPLAEGAVVDLEAQPYFIVRPHRVFAWLEESFPGTATRWVFAGGDRGQGKGRARRVAGY